MMLIDKFADHYAESSALCSLHRYNLFLNTYSSQMAQAEQDFTRTSRLALKSFARIATDGASTKLYDRVDGARNTAPYTLHFFREMAVLVLQMGYEEGKKTQHLLTEISSLTNYLSVASEKWKLAGERRGSYRRESELIRLQQVGIYKKSRVRLQAYVAGPDKNN